MATPYRKYHGALAALFLALAVITVYWQTGRFEFIDWDDELYVTANRHVQAGLTLEGLRWAFTTFHATNWHPLTWLSHMLDVQLFGLDAGRHHLTNVLLHLGNTLLLFFVLRRMTGAMWRSAFVAALFGLHPLHVESVAWVAERKDVLSTFFGMLTLYAYARYAERPGLGRYLPVVLFFTLGLMSKPMLVTLPFLLLMLDYWPLGRLCGGSPQGLPVARLLVEKIPLFALTAASCVITFIAQKSGGAVTALSGAPVHEGGHAVTYYVGVGERISNALVSYACYLGKMIYPRDLAFFYPFREAVPGWQAAGAGLLIGVVSLTALYAIRRAPCFFVGWFWFLGTLVPVIGLVQVGWQSMADRYTYVPLIGLFIVIAWGAPELLRRRPGWKKGMAAAGLALVAAAMVLSLQQVRYWKDSITLYRHAVEATPDSGFAHFKLGTALAEQGALEQSLGHFREALRIQPYDIRARYNLGLALFQLKRFDKAIEQFAETLRIYPSFEPAQRRLNMARAMLERAAEPTRAPHGDPAAARMRAGLALEKQGRPDEAIREYEKALELNPDHVNAHQRLGVVLHRLGRLDEAIGHYREVVRLRPGSAAAHYNLGLALADQGRIDAAIGRYREALRIRPDFAEVYNNLGVALYRKGDFEQAIASFNEALRIRPGYAQARKNLERMDQTFLKKSRSATDMPAMPEAAAE
ncbi:MAG TPA: tetratricopeptide repeat protein [Sedimenticola sp.]|nr:tetratricopeptide repeat protein [Sedimenticola sp.]